MKKQNKVALLIHIFTAKIATISGHMQGALFS